MDETCYDLNLGLANKSRMSKGSGPRWSETWQSQRKYNSHSKE
jgi:hypothetical protein